MGINYNLPPDQQINVVCAITAASKYDIPTNIFLAVVEKEGGKPGQYVKNKNGTYDIGPLQFNTAYVKTLFKYNITYKDVEGHNNSCYPYYLAAWRIKNHIVNDDGDLFKKVSNYHSRTPKYNSIYKIDLIKRSEKAAAYLNSHFSNINKISIKPFKHSINSQNQNQIRNNWNNLKSQYVERAIYIRR